MAALALYRSAIKKLLNDFVSLVKSSSGATTVDTLSVFDEANDLYMVYRVGWDRDFRVSNISICFRIIDGKIWIEENETEMELVPELIEAGVPEKDICLGFHHPLERELLASAVA